MKYSQFGEEDVIKTYFPDGYIGGCIDVGASDGVSISNTKEFEEMGWYCMCIEPNPRYFRELRKNRTNTVECAVSNKNSVETFYIVNLGNGVEDAVSALEIDAKLISQFSGYTITPIKVKTLTLDECIERYYEYDTIDFISIDTEGTELDVLKGFDINKWSPKLLVIENNFNDPEIEEYLKEFGYRKVHRLAVNDFYIK